MMLESIQFNQMHELQPAITKSLVGLNQAAQDSGLELTLIYLIKLRVSQINGCEFCFQLNLAEARKLGETPSRLQQLARWTEADCFSQRERTALAWAEALTHIAQGLNGTEFQQAAAEFSAAELVNLSAVIVAINGWNRMALGLGFQA